MKKIKVYTVVYNRTDLLEIQVKCFRKFFGEDLDFFVVDNSEKDKLSQEFSSLCDKIGCYYIKANENKQEHRPGFKHANALNFLWQNYASKDIDSYVIVCDPDVFPISHISLEDKFSKNYAIASAMQHRMGYHHITPILAIFDMSRIPDAKSLCWDAGYFAEGVANLDTGGRTYEYLKMRGMNNLVLNMKMSGSIRKESAFEVFPIEIAGSYNESYCLEFHSNNFLHYSKGSNWNGMSEDFHLRKTGFVFDMLDGLLADRFKAKIHDIQEESEYWGKWNGENW